MPQLFRNWLRRADGRYVHLTKDGYLLILTSIGDGWVWSAWRKKSDEWNSCSPSGRRVHSSPKECVNELERWYMSQNIVRIE